MAATDPGGTGQANSVTGGAVYSAIISAAGYNRLKLADHPLAQLPEEAQPKIHANTISNSVHPAQSALPGLGTAGRRLAEELAARLVPEDRRVELVPHKPGFDPRDVPIATVDGYIRSGGIAPNFVEHVKKEIEERGSSSQAGYLTFPAVDPKLRDLFHTPADHLSAAEREVLSRGLELQDRLKKAAVEIYKPLT